MSFLWFYSPTLSTICNPADLNLSYQEANLHLKWTPGCSFITILTWFLPCWAATKPCWKMYVGYWKRVIIKGFLFLPTVQIGGFRLQFKHLFHRNDGASHLDGTRLAKSSLPKGDEQVVPLSQIIIRVEECNLKNFLQKFR